uniref:Uncharacterized protein n=1 Tax=Drosophila melanogaster TaxID=7227 RepID=A0A0B4KG57_DROME|nr:uncharacterized protein Dmel_CG44090 [Drosophila melanogaster]AGB96047.1 uncharacterized protein Dmel_CG44090 [Drosophila melanogaster]|eukprot:NP_001262667.1 uncharacterized protein Dmel_CG44090 [Drosophila melanogaster]
MKFVAALLVISLGILALAEADPIVEQCPSPCTREYRPVCAEWRRHIRGTTRPVISRCTFATECVLNNHRCRTNQNWVTIDETRKCRNETSDCDRLRKLT